MATLAAQQPATKENGRKNGNPIIRPKAKIKDAPQQSWRFGRKAWDSNHTRLTQAINDLVRGAGQQANTSLPRETGQLTISPETAHSWLKRNKSNRPISTPLVRFLMREIEQGRWVLNGQSISFKTSGELNDGQHRLIACVLAARPIQSVVAVNVPEAAFVTVDTGRPRRAPDILALAGFHYGAAVAAAVRWDVAYQRGQLSWTMKRPALRLSNQEILDAVRGNPVLPELAARYYTQRQWVRLMPPSVFIFALGRLQEIDRPAAETFFAQLSSGANLAPGSAILTLRERLLEARATGMRLEEGVLLGFIVKGWNAWREGRELERLFVRKADKFPDFVGAQKP